MLLKKADEIRICLGSSCFARGNKEMVKEVEAYLHRHHLDEKIVLKGSHCLGNCADGPNISINGQITGHIDKSNIIKMLDEKLKP